MVVFMLLRVGEQTTAEGKKREAVELKIGVRVQEGIVLLQ